ncbi:MAG TPA: CvpA family protein [Defluviitaleaceae bacterium]|nr:CvpA family protein [Defluviitaleaceae bacterium]
MNLFDLLILIFLAFSCWVAYKRGLVLSLFKLVSRIISIFLSYKLYPVVSAFLREMTPLYENIKGKISPSLLPESTAQANTLAGQSAIINNLGIPGFVKSSLIENNNPEIYKILNVDGLKDYIAGYIANICINIISLILVFIIVSIALRIIIGILDLISKLPVLSSINNLFGLIFGLISGLINIWFFFIILFILQPIPAFEKAFVYLDQSLIAKSLYEYNLLLKWISGIFVF